MAEIRCSVSGCFYWELGNQCTADTIWVRPSQRAAAAAGRLEDASYATATSRWTSEDTCCETYRPKIRDPEQV